jgi:serine protease Do
MLAPMGSRRSWSAAMPLRRPPPEWTVLVPLLAAVIGALLLLIWSAPSAAAGLVERSRALERARMAVVGLQAQAVADARSAATLGSSREGSGVVIGADGLILTIGYLVLEADQVMIEIDPQRTIPARVIGSDVATGFALVQALAPLPIAPVPLGRSGTLAPGQPLTFVSAGAEGDVATVQLAARRPFSGSWEYHIDDALFTTPAQPDHSGAGLFDADGALVGIGSLLIRDLDGAGPDPAAQRSANLFVPIDLLRPVLGEMRRFGHSAASVRAWIGIHAIEHHGAVLIARVVDDSPADVAGLQAGDRILRLDGREIADLATLWQTLWAGSVQRTVRVEIERGNRSEAVEVHSVDRATTLRHPEGI